MKTDRDNQGFTVLELLIAVVATAILVMIASLLLVMPYRSLYTNIEHANLRRDMTVAVRMMADDIRESSVNGITAVENSLTLPANSTRAKAVEYRRNPGDGSLATYINNVAQMTIVSKGLARFNPVAVNDLGSGLSGVTLRLEMNNDDGGIGVVNETFIHTRN